MAQVQKGYNDYTFILSDIGNGDTINLPGGFFGIGHKPICVDEAELKPFLDTVEKNFAALDKEMLGKMLHDKNYAVDPALFAFGIAYGMAMDEHYPGAVKNIDGRVEYYGSKEVKMLSDTFKTGHAACFEFSALAQMAMKRVGIETKMICGDVAWSGNADREFPDELHSFLLVRTGSGAFIYDPVNPQDHDKKRWPGISRIGDDLGGLADKWLQSQREEKPRKSYVHVKGMFNGKEAFYGFNNLGVINLAKDCLNPPNNSQTVA